MEVQPFLQILQKYGPSVFWASSLQKGGMGWPTFMEEEGLSRKNHSLQTCGSLRPMR